MISVSGTNASEDEPARKKWREQTRWLGGSYVICSIYRKKNENYIQNDGTYKKLRIAAISDKLKRLSAVEYVGAVPLTFVLVCLCLVCLFIFIENLLAIKLSRTAVLGPLTPNVMWIL